MVSLLFLFYLFVFLFAIIGAMRGWAKEMLVSFAVILALFILTVLEVFVPFIRETVTGASRFWLRLLILAALVFFGYQGPNLPRLAGSGRFARERLQDTLLGLFLGALNGYLIFGSIWYFMHASGYPFASITAPDFTTAAGQDALQVINLLPPEWLGVAPAIYFAVALSFVFVLVVFI